MSNRKLLVGTRKGLMEFHKSNEQWKFHTCHFKAIPVTIVFEDERNGTWWACLDHGHWGVKLNRSTDEGKTWEEISTPKYPEGYEVKKDVLAKTEYIWAMSDGGENYPDRLWMGTIPGGLFLSEDGGLTWSLNESLWNHPSRVAHWFGAGFDHPGIHSILVDPRNNDHITVGISVAGVFETWDGGETWNPMNKGLFAEFLPDPHVEVGHDPHIIASTKNNPDIIWQQNHCGIYNSIDGGKNWNSLSKKGEVAHFGFAIALQESNSKVAYVAPAIADEYRIAVEEALCICRTDDGGKTWKELRNGLPQENCFDLIYRHAMVANENEVVFGTTTGNLFYSDNQGEKWEVISNYLPMVYSLIFTKKN